MLLTAGERISIALLAMAIREAGAEAISFTGSQAAIITGEIHTADPRRVPAARRIPEISYAEMTELASAGAQVMHPRAVEIGARFGIAIRVLSSLGQDSPAEAAPRGTLITRTPERMEELALTGITSAAGQVELVLRGLPAGMRTPTEILVRLAEAGIDVHAVSTSAISITLLVPSDRVDDALPLLHGATGAVGRTMLDVLAERAFPLDRLMLLASPRSEGATVRWGKREWTVRAPSPGCFRGVGLALFSAGAARSEEWAPRAAGEGAIVIDNSSAWRMDPDVPLVVPEVNVDTIRQRPKNIIANPNCSTIQMVMALKPLHDAAEVVRVVATTFQSVSGAGERGRENLRRELCGETAGDSPFARTIAGNALPRIGDFDPQGWTGEERKMSAETRKILSSPDLPVAAIRVRVPVDAGHAVSIAVETARELSMEDAWNALNSFTGIRVGRDADFPTPREVAVQIAGELIRE